MAVTTANGSQRLRSRPTLLALAAALACACASAPAGDEARTPAAHPAAVPAAPAPIAARPALEGLDDVLAAIAGGNPTVAQAQARLDEARAALAGARATTWPELSVGVDFVSSDAPSRAFALLLDQRQVTLGPGFDPDPGATEGWREEVRLDWALFAPGRADEERAAEEGESVARFALLAVQRRLLNAGVQTWLGLGAARALEQVARESIALLERQLELTRRRQADGAALRVDVLRLETRLAAARQDAARAALDVRRTESALNLLMGVPADHPLPSAHPEQAPSLAADLPAGLDAALARARAERADLWAAAHRARMLDHQREAAAAGHRPDLRAFAIYGIDGGDPTPDIDLDSYTAGVGLRWSLTRATGPRVRAAEARLRRAQLELSELALAVTREVRDAWEELALARETLALATSAETTAAEAVRVVAAAHEAGAATVTDLLESEDAHRRARVRAVAARAGLDIWAARLIAAMGGVR